MYKADGSFVEQYISVDDDAVMTTTLEDTRTVPPARDIFQRLHDRRLYKEVYCVPIDERGVPHALVRTWLMGLPEQDEEGRRRRGDVERKVAKIVGCDPWEVIVLVQSVSNPAYGGLGELNPEEVYVISDFNEPRYLSECPDLIVDSKVRAARSVHVIANEDKLARGTRETIRPRIYEALVESAGVKG